MLDWEAYEERRRRREEARVRRRRAAVRRRRAAAGIGFAVGLGAAGFSVASQVGAGASASDPGSRPAGRSSSHPAPTTREPTTGTASSPATSPPAKPHGEVELAAVGDTMLGMTPTLPPSPGTFFDGVHGELRGDIVFANLEGTLTDRPDGKCGSGSASCFAFRAPPSYARYLRQAGFTIVSNGPCTAPGSPRPGCPTRSRSSACAGCGSRSSASRRTPTPPP